MTKALKILRGGAPLYPSRLQKQPGMNGVALAFILGAAGAAAILVPFLIVDKGFFLYCGDYNSQQIPFYYYVQNFLRTQSGTWSWATDLGSSVVNSYSFYNLGSPFLWLTLPFPSRWLPYLMAPLFLLKFGCLAASGCLYLSRYAKTRNMAVVCGLVYAFSGINVYNIFFNHMLEAAIIFPLMLWAMDNFMYEGRRGLFALFVGLALLNNYFFFLGNVTFAILYFFIKVLSDDYKFRWGKLGVLAFEAVLGLGIGMVLALPAFYNLIQNPRTDNFASGMNVLIFGRAQQYFSIIASMFLPPDPPYLPNVFTDGAIKWTSMSFFMPIVGMAGVFAYCRARRGAVRRLLAASLVMALVPILNSSYYAFNASYYARWYYMPVLIAALATLRALEDADINLWWGIKAVAIGIGAFALFGLVPTEVDGGWKLGVAEYASKFWLTILTAAFGLGVLAFLWRNWRGRVRFAPLLLGAVMGFSVLYSVIHISLGKFVQWERDANYKAQMYDGSAQLDLPEDEGFYRIDTYGGDNDNLGLWVNKSGLQNFNSVVSPSIMEFYPMLGVTRDVSSKPDTANYALRGLLSVKYTIMPHAHVDSFLSASGTEGFSYYDTRGPFTIYKNENFVPLGFTYSQYVPMRYLEGIAESERAPMLVRAIGLTDEQQAAHAELFAGGAAVSWQADAAGENGEAGGYYDYEATGYTRYTEDCDARRQESSYATYYDASGFTCHIDMARENLVFFAVPYDEGFTATVNGEGAEVLRVSGGMMAVRAPAGENEIVFRYQTPGLAVGAAVSLAALAVLAAYVALSVARNRKREAENREEEGKIT